MDFFLNWCINCGKRSEDIYCCKECRLNDLKRNKGTNINTNNYTLEFKNRKPVQSNINYKTSRSRSVTPLLEITIPHQPMNSPNSYFYNSENSNGSSNGSSPMSTSSSPSSLKQNISNLISLSPPKDDKLQVSSQKPRYYVQTFQCSEQNQKVRPPQQQHIKQPQQLLTPLSEKDNMEFESASNNLFATSQMYSEKEVNENSSHWYWSSSDDEDED